MAWYVLINKATGEPEEFVQSLEGVDQNKFQAKLIPREPGEFEVYTGTALAEDQEFKTKRIEDNRLMKMSSAERQAEAVALALEMIAKDPELVRRIGGTP